MFQIVNIILFVLILLILNQLAKKRVSFSKRVFIALVIGVLFGLLLKTINSDGDILLKSKEYFDIVGKGYVSLLRMISMPLIIVSITTSIINIEEAKSAARNSTLIIAVLLTTAGIASIISQIVSLGFKLDATNILAGTREIEAGNKILEKVVVTNQSITERVITFISTNPFLDFTGARSTSTIAVVIFCMFFGFAILRIKSKKPEKVTTLIELFNSLNEVVLTMVKMVLRLTPYGVFALITNVLIVSNYKDVLQLIQFVGASYVAIILMFIVHLIIVYIFGLSPVTYVKKSISALTFAFTSRTSSGTIPLTVEAQENMGVEKGIANIAATFGTSIGQNGCAAIYPTMLAIMIAPTIGINPFDIFFLIKLVIIVVISSLGVSGVGGGATFAAIIVLSTLGFPIELAGLLISVEPLIDMGRTALNVNDSILAGVVTARLTGNLNKEQFSK